MLKFEFALADERNQEENKIWEKEFKNEYKSYLEKKNQQKQESKTECEDHENSFRFQDENQKISLFKEVSLNYLTCTSDIKKQE
jgi:hypothetical protein